MKLYYTPGACSLSPHIVAREAGVEITLEQVDLASKKTRNGEDFLAVNPKGYVPALELDDGAVLTEGPAIVQYLADLKPESGLAPAPGTFERYRLQEWLNFIATELHKQYGPLFNPELPAQRRDEVHANLGKRYAFVAPVLEKQPYLLGEQFTAADAYLFTVTNWASMLKVDLSAWSAIGRYQERVAQRAAVRAALVAEGLVRAA